MRERVVGLWERRLDHVTERGLRLAEEMQARGLHEEAAQVMAGLVRLHEGIENVLRTDCGPAGAVDDKAAGQKA